MLDSIATHMVDDKWPWQIPDIWWAADENKQSKWWSLTYCEFKCLFWAWSNPLEGRFTNNNKSFTCCVNVFQWLHMKRHTLPHIKDRPIPLSSASLPRGFATKVVVVLLCFQGVWASFIISMIAVCWSALNILSLFGCVHVCAYSFKEMFLFCLHASSNGWSLLPVSFSFSW